MTCNRETQRTGEAELALASVSPAAEQQPGGRPPAPGDLALVQAFMNSRWDLGRLGPDRDQFQSRDALARWFTSRGLLEAGTSVTATQRQRSLDVRDGLQALALVNNGATADFDLIARLNRALRVPALFVQLDPSTGPDFQATRRDFDAALAMIGTIAAIAQLNGDWRRLKACRGPHCGWSFYDHSRNQAGSWCAMAVCGSRTKARAYRRRKGRARHEKAL